MQSLTKSFCFIFLSRVHAACFTRHQLTVRRSRAWLAPQQSSTWHTSNKRRCDKQPFNPRRFLPLCQTVSCLGPVAKYAFVLMSRCRLTSSQRRRLSGGRCKKKGVFNQDCSVAEAGLRVGLYNGEKWCVHEQLEIKKSWRFSPCWLQAIIIELIGLQLLFYCVYLNYAWKTLVRDA